MSLNVAPVFEYRKSLSACRFQYPEHPMSLPLCRGQFVSWYEMFHFGGRKACTLHSLCSRLLCFGPHCFCPLCCAPLPSSAPRNAFGLLCDCDVTGPNVTLLGASFGRGHLGEQEASRLRFRGVLRPRRRRPRERPPRWLQPGRSQHLRPLCPGEAQEARRDGPQGKGRGPRGLRQGALQIALARVQRLRGPPLQVPPPTSLQVLLEVSSPQAGQELLQGPRAPPVEVPLPEPVPQLQPRRRQKQGTGLAQPLPPPRAVPLPERPPEVQRRGRGG